ncbi:MAG: lysozyme [Carnobacterium sp.]|uniref:lysozyme n=1 Tax=Carnobacterium sp. TaxID=48221 RepID=UPI003314FBDE
MANENMKISHNGKNLIREFEGLKLQAYQDQVGVWTIGYGHTKDVKPGMSITEAQAIAFLDGDIESHAAGIFNYVTVQLNQNQFDALVSFHFNLGAYILKGSTLLTYINNKQWQAAAAKMKEYINADGSPSAGLIRRRNAETELFLKTQTGDDEGMAKAGKEVMKCINYLTIYEKPTRTSNVLKTKTKDSSMTVEGYVYGEAVYGNNIWWYKVEGGFAFSGDFVPKIDQLYLDKSNNL